MPVYREPQPVTDKLAVPLRLIPPEIHREIMEAVNHGQVHLLTFTVKRSFSATGVAEVTDYGREATLVFDVYADNITFESE